MKFVPELLCLYLLCLFGNTLCDEKGSAVIYVDEGRDVTLPCSLSTKDNIELNLFDWRKDDQMEVFTYDRGFHYNNGRSGQSEQFKVRVFHFPDELKYGNASIRIRNVKVADSGDYTCEFPLQQKRDKIHIKLVVAASPEPYVTLQSMVTAQSMVPMLGQREDGVLLQCEVRGASPKPRVEWQDSAGNILPAEETLVSERGGHFYIILQTTVTKTDHYRCVVTQEEINHETDAMTYVPVCGSMTPKENENQPLIEDAHGSDQEIDGSDAVAPPTPESVV
ncbi:butyrophilin subfamily 2 member A2-like isoform X2 [Sander lucioperca]|uniref:butyrophilin subfamily 2 member A2-like isoform X2 n=1 Tax=Sander lucioperca TaxID=283035 RepID=UPI0016537595|nr:butyrophilin subfamily 2 member A2-like isoform X2 [Sander lucioperca]